jgi:hypothetical protein
MDERNIISGTAAVAFSGMLDYLYPLRWFALAGLIIVFADLRFGIEAAIVRKEVIRRSRAIRRTFNKIVDYTCWILLASSLDHALGEPFNIPILSALIMLVVFGVEINSCFSNYFESKGKKIKVNVFDFFRKKTDIIEVKEEDLNNDKK